MMSLILLVLHYAISCIVTDTLFCPRLLSREKHYRVGNSKHSLMQD